MYIHHFLCNYHIFNTVGTCRVIKNPPLKAVQPTRISFL